MRPDLTGLGPRKVVGGLGLTTPKRRLSWWMNNDNDRHLLDSLIQLSWEMEGEEASTIEVYNKRYMIEHLLL